LLSGLLQEDKYQMITAAEHWGMRLVKERFRAGWLALLFSN
jgi:hypothetical protein